MPRPRDLPDRARVVIIGGGVGGASIAYHLAELGEKEVVLVDRDELTSGSTFHSAGLVGQLRSSVSLTKMMMHSVELYRTLECGWVECGGLRLACTPEREEEVMRQVAWAKTFGLPLELVTAEEAVELFPLMVPDDIRCGSYLATDGYLDPSQLTYALAEAELVVRREGFRPVDQTRDLRVLHRGHALDGVFDDLFEARPVLGEQGAVEVVRDPVDQIVVQRPRSTIALVPAHDQALAFLAEVDEVVRVAHRR